MGDLTHIIVIAVVVLVLLIAFYLIYKSMWKVAEPNQALIISGWGRNKDNAQGFGIVTGKGVLILPGQQARVLDLSMREAQLKSDCYTKQGIQVHVEGVAIYKVGDDEASIANAARRFLNAKPDDLTRNITSLLDGHLRSIIGGLALEDIVRQRDALTKETKDAAGIDAVVLGLKIDTLQISSIKDSVGFMDNLAKPYIAENNKNARVAEATNDQIGTETEQAVNAKKAEFERDSLVKQAGFTADQATAKAQADQAGPLAQALAKQAVTQAETTTAKMNADLTEMNLQTSVRKPADAEAYRIKVQAQANADATLATATADGAASKLRGEGLAAATQANLLAEASGIKARGDALAANAESVINQTIAENMANIVEKIATPLGNIKNFTVLDGAQGITRAITSVAATAGTLLPLINTAYKQIKDASKDANS